jgi:hypothetical protein
MGRVLIVDHVRPVDPDALERALADACARAGPLVTARPLR